jgi:hypothetical protein
VDPDPPKSFKILSTAAADPAARYVYLLNFINLSFSYSTTFIDD